MGIKTQETETETETETVETEYNLPKNKKEQTVALMRAVKFIENKIAKGMLDSVEESQMEFYKQLTTNRIKTDNQIKLAAQLEKHIQEYELAKSKIKDREQELPEDEISEEKLLSTTISQTENDSGKQSMADAGVKPEDQVDTLEGYDSEKMASLREISNRTLPTNDRIKELRRELSMLLDEIDTQKELKIEIENARAIKQSKEMEEKLFKELPQEAQDLILAERKKNEELVKKLENSEQENKKLKEIVPKGTEVQNLSTMENNGGAVVKKGMLASIQNAMKKMTTFKNEVMDQGFKNTAINTYGILKKTSKELFTTRDGLYKLGKGVTMAAITVAALPFVTTLAAGAMPTIAAVAIAKFGLSSTTTATFELVKQSALKTELKKENIELYNSKDRSEDRTKIVDKLRGELRDKHATELKHIRGKKGWSPEKKKERIKELTTTFDKANDDLTERIKTIDGFTNEKDFKKYQKQEEKKIQNIWKALKQAFVSGTMSGTIGAALEWYRGPSTDVIGGAKMTPSEITIATSDLGVEDQLDLIQENIDNSQTPEMKMAFMLQQEDIVEKAIAAGDTSPELAGKLTEIKIGIHNVNEVELQSVEKELGQDKRLRIDITRLGDMKSSLAELKKGDDFFKILNLQNSIDELSDSIVERGGEQLDSLETIAHTNDLLEKQSELLEKKIEFLQDTDPKNPEISELKTNLDSVNESLSSGSLNENKIRIGEVENKISGLEDERWLNDPNDTTPSEKEIELMKEQKLLIEEKISLLEGTGNTSADIDNLNIQASALNDTITNFDNSQLDSIKDFLDDKIIPSENSGIQERINIHYKNIENAVGNIQELSGVEDFNSKAIINEISRIESGINSNGALSGDFSKLDKLIDTEMLKVEGQINDLSDKSPLTEFQLEEIDKLVAKHESLQTMSDNIDVALEEQHLGVHQATTRDVILQSFENETGVSNANNVDQAVNSLSNTNTSMVNGVASEHTTGWGISTPERNALIKKVIDTGGNDFKGIVEVNDGWITSDRMDVNYDKLAELSNKLETKLDSVSDLLGRDNIDNLQKWQMSMVEEYNKHLPVGEQAIKYSNTENSYEFARKIAGNEGISGAMREQATNYAQSAENMKKMTLLDSLSKTNPKDLGFGNHELTGSNIPDTKEVEVKKEDVEVKKEDVEVKKEDVEVKKEEYDPTKATKSHFYRSR